jgi:hypothetical protein
VRLLRAAHLAALGTALIILGSLLVLAVPAVRTRLGQFIAGLSDALPAAIVAFSVLAVVVATLGLVALVHSQRRGWLRLPHFIALWTLVLAAAAYLAWDDPAVRYPLTFEDLVPTQTGDDTSFALFLRYGKNTPATNAVTAPKLQFGAAAGNLATDPEKWIAFLRANRAEIEAEWAKLTPVRAWWDELAALPRIGDLTAPHPDAPILAFQPTRLHAQLTVAIASLQALDGHGDEAMGTLTRLYSVARKFESNSRTLVRAMIAKVIQRMSLNTAGFVLDRTAVSPAARAAFAAELAAAPGGPTGARHLAIIEYAFSQPMIAEFSRGTPLGGLQPVDSLQRAVRFFGPLVFNPRATVNLLGERFHLVADLAAARRLKELEDRNHPVNRPFLADYHGKNLAGRLLVDMAFPALSKVVKSYWEIDDLRLVMITRLRA